MHIYFPLIVFLLGLYSLIISNDSIKKLISLSIAQSGIILMYIFLCYSKSGVAPIYNSNITQYVDPVPQVLMLTAIVVGFATNALGLAIIIKIK